jgi:hypothetical protein
MSDVSRLIRERALAILRDTRAKIDPALLSAMKDHIKTAMPGMDADMPLSAKGKGAAGGAGAEPKKFIPPEMPEPITMPDSHEAVDKQKIAQIVLHYMKHREGGKPH